MRAVGRRKTRRKTRRDKEGGGHRSFSVINKERKEGEKQHQQSYRKLNSQTDQ